MHSLKLTLKCLLFAILGASVSATGSIINLPAEHKIDLSDTNDSPPTRSLVVIPSLEVAVSNGTGQIRYKELGSGPAGHFWLSDTSYKHVVSLV
jgi:hypothetical protein